MPAQPSKPRLSPESTFFLATSDIHLKHKLEIGREECVERVVEGVERAKKLVDDVEFSPEDATRTDVAFLCQVVQAAVEAGATTINIPDTVGYTLPREYRSLIETLFRDVEGLENTVVSVHCHDDLGLAVANSLAALDAGARQVECTINGIGERAGNASLEEIVMTLRVRKDLTEHHTDIQTTALYKTSQLLSHITGIHPQPNKAIVGRNAFSHEAGIHQHGMLKERMTYEIMTPEMVGAPGTRLVLGKHSGRHGLRNRYQELGYDLSDEELNQAYKLFTLVADQKKSVLDEDLLVILHHGALTDAPESFRLVELDVNCGGKWSTARVMVSYRDGPPERGVRKRRRAHRRGLLGNRRTDRRHRRDRRLRDRGSHARPRCDWRGELARTHRRTDVRRTGRLDRRGGRRRPCLHQRAQQGRTGRGPGGDGVGEGELTRRPALKWRIAVLGGDGVGPEVTEASLEVLRTTAERFGHEFIADLQDVGFAAYERSGNPLPEETLAACRSADAVLLGAVGIRAPRGCPWSCVRRPRSWPFVRRWGATPISARFGSSPLWRRPLRYAPRSWTAPTF